MPDIDSTELALVDIVAKMTKNERLALIEHHGETMFATERDNPSRELHGAICAFIGAVHGHPGSGAAPTLRRTLEQVPLPYLNALVVVRRELVGDNPFAAFHRALAELGAHIHDARIVTDRQVLAEATKIVDLEEDRAIGIEYLDTNGDVIDRFGGTM